MCAPIRCRPSLTAGQTARRCASPRPRCRPGGPGARPRARRGAPRLAPCRLVRLVEGALAACVARQLVRAQALERGGPQAAVVGPRLVLDLADQLRPDPVDAAD